MSVRPHSGLTRDKQSRKRFHKSFLDTTSRLCGRQCVQPVNCLCIDNAKQLRGDLKEFSSYLRLENEDDLFHNCDNGAFNMN